MASNSDFFSEKKGWSLLKDNLLGYYLVPYTSKILTTGKPLTFIDCFAGKGRFDTGEKGSPIIIAENIRYFMEKENNRHKDISAVFIEKKYSKELCRNIKEYDFCTVWNGTFESNVKKILQLDSNKNLFLYIDPYGIKSLDFSIFKSITDKGFRSLEMLMNFNTFGFLREACRILKYDNLANEFDDEDGYEVDLSNNKENMNCIANGEYWQHIIEQYRNREITMHQAEEFFTQEYKKRICGIFRFVIDIPIKTRTRNIPKYRLIFATNKDDGLILMADNMCKRWKDIKEQEVHGQISIFEYMPEVDTLDSIDLKSGILNTIKKHGKPILLKELIVELIERYGISFTEKELKGAIRAMDGSQIDITWDPEKTRTGRKITSMDYDLYKITVEVRAEEQLDFFSMM